MKAFLFLMGLLAFGFAGPASADVTMERCACSSEAQWAAKAASFGSGHVGYLYDFKSRQVRKFRNSGTILGSGDGMQLQAGGDPEVLWLQVEARYQQQFDDMLTVRDYFARPLSAITITYHLPADASNSHGAPVGSYNAYSMMTASSFENHLRIHLQEQRQAIFDVIPNAGVANALARLLQALDKVFTNGELLKVEITVIFPDGSEAIFIDDGGKPARKPGETVDRNQNTIPESPADGRGYYDIDARDLEAWTHYMQSMGVQFTSGSGMIFCTWDGHTLACRVPFSIQ